MISTTINKKNSVSNITSTGHSKSMIPFLRNRNSSFQSLQTAAQQQQHQQQQEHQQPKNQQGQEQYQTPNPAFAKNNSNVNSNISSSSSVQSRKDVSIDMNSPTKGKGLIRRTNVPPAAAPNAIKISAAGQQEQQRQVQRMSSVQSKPSPGATTTTAAAGHKMLFRNISARFHPSTELIPVVETVAQEYARTIKALWRMVEEEELSYQIDAAATAARQRQEELQRLVAQNNSTAIKPRHNFKTFPGERVHHRIGQSDDDACCCKQEEQSRAVVALAVRGHRLSSSSSVPNDDDDCEDPEEQEERLRELQQLERELVILGLQQYQDASTESEPLPQEQQSPSESSRQYDSRRESFQESAVQPGWPVEQTVQIEQAKASSPQPQPQQQPQRRQRQRQNSLAYEERRADLDALRTQVKATAVETATTTKATVPATSSSPLLSFRDGVREGGAENDDDDDAVVLKVARRVSVRLHTQSHHDWSTFLEQDRQRPSYDVERARGRGASWAPPPRTTTLANARHSRMLSMSEVKAATTATPTPVMSTMVSAS
ncbi:hypothetical protein BGX34_010941 [Mortierella sp. NVP85]|nr:hypothetical protein BGX34_010941 [Mortierella sp. NVP85]